MCRAAGPLPRHSLIEKEAPGAMTRWADGSLGREGITMMGSGTGRLLGVIEWGGLTDRAYGTAPRSALAGSPTVRPRTPFRAHNHRMGVGRALSGDVIQECCRRGSALPSLCRTVCVD